jgi:hypothetical protein
VKRPPSHQTDDAAKVVFRDLLPKEWAVQELAPDYGIDFRVEVFESCRSTGEVFLVQLKGSTRLRRSGRGARLHVTHSLRAANLTDYVDQNREPVFLVVADVTKREAFWVFLQGYAESNALGSGWRRKRNVTIRIPTVDALASTAKLRDAVACARRSMADKYPGTPPAAIRAAKAEAEALDPRLSVDVRADATGTHYTLNAKQPFTFTLTAKGEPDELVRKMADLVDRGLPVGFGPNELKVSGTPIFGERFTQLGCVVQATTRQDVLLSLVGLDNSGSEVGRIDGIPCTLSGGRRERRLEGGMPSGPIQIKATVLFQDVPEKRSGRFLSFQFEKWGGLPILSLPFFDAVYSVFGPGRFSSQLRAEVVMPKGGGAIPVLLTLHDRKFVTGFGQILEVLRKARELARAYAVNPVFVITDMGHNEMRDIDDLHALVFGDGIERKAPGASFRFRIGRAGVPGLLEQRYPGPLTTTGTKDVALLGQVIRVGTVSVTMSSMTLKQGIEALRREYAEGAKDEFDCEFVATGENVITEKLTERAH